MNIHEYQAKEIFRRHGIPTPQGIPVLDKDGVGAKAAEAAKKLIDETGNQVVVVKAQIHAGGRGKAGGVKVVKGPDAAKAAAEELMGKTLVTPQTGAEGKLVQRLYVEQGLDIAREIYLAVTIDREKKKPVIMCSSEGGVEIEEVAEKHPEKIFKVWVDPAVGLMPYQVRQLAFGLGLEGKEQMKGFSKLLTNLSKLFIAEDCSIAEINPLVVTKDDQVVALDAKINFDSNGAFRHKEWAELEDASETAATEREAGEAGLSFIQLDGNIGCLVNGAGLAMSTMDTIQHFGGQPANFLDVGGGATQEAVTKAFTIILQSKEVQGIFVNIFGGIMKCDIIANGVVEATKKLGLEVPLVVRLAGTNVEKGKEILANSGLDITPADTMAEGAKKIVELAAARAAKA
ncbi:MAG: ADP-forming succinate--CoA ligase subunit beta [Sandaracinus sp.]|nr:ADP-forming succinate--CoA ligase subunit beta [Sandaracinus sp.]|tara:strand:- start:749 stop:1954 length:1206 start_codon:yes stop_codon:yes gene_type:complete